MSKWKTIDPLPVARQRLAAAALKNYVYVAGGCSDSAQATPVLSILKSRINAVDDGNGPWLDCAPAMTDGKIGASLVLLHPSAEPQDKDAGNSYLMLIGGRGTTLTAAGQATAQDIYVGKLDSDGNIPKWVKTAGALPVPLVEPGAFVWMNFLYVFGGKQVTNTLGYKTQVHNFAVGENLWDRTSGATATVVSDVDGGSTGTLTLSNVVGAFANNDLITVIQAQSTTANEIRIDYTAKTGAFTVGLTVTGGTSAAHGVIVRDSNPGSSGAGYLVINTVTGTFSAAETITDTSTGSATNTAAQYNAIDFASGTVAFNDAEIVYGKTSGAHATVSSHSGTTAAGTLKLTSITGTFVAGESLAQDFATASGAIVISEVANTTCWRAHLDPNGTVNAFTQLSTVLPAAPDRGDVEIHGVDKAVFKSGTNLYVARLMAGGDVGKFSTIALAAESDLGGLLALQSENIMVFGGDTANDGAHASAAVYGLKVDQDGNPVGKWFQVDPMPSAKEAFGVCLLRDRVFMVGGINSAGTVQTEAAVARVDPSGAIGIKQ